MAKDTVANNEAITFKEAVAARPRRLNYWTLYRWATKGMRGVVLESWFEGGHRCTSLDAIDRFNAKLTALRTKTVESPMRRHREDQDVRAQLRARLGV